MSDIEIRVDPAEERSFRQHSNIPWHPLGMCCQVPSCPDMRLFSTFFKYVDHYVAVHRPRICKYKCSECHKNLANGNKSQHWKTHKSPSKPVTFTKTMEPNPKYIDPGHVLIPRPPLSRRHAGDVETDSLFSQHMRQELSQKQRDCSTFNRGRLSQAEIMDRYESSSLND